MTDLARIDTEQRDAACVVHIHGEVDISNAEDVLAAIETAVPPGADELVVDLTGTSYLDSAGVGLLLRLGERLRGRRQEMRLVAPPDHPVRAVLDLAAVTKLVPVADRLD